MVTSCDLNGVPNVAPFSFLMPVSFDPKYVAFAVSPKRHTYKNLVEVGEFVISIPTADMLELVWACGTKSGRDIDKFSLLGLKTEKARKVRPPLLKSLPVQFECKVEFMREFGDHFLVVGKVLEEHVETTDFKPLLHYSGRDFAFTSERVQVR